MESGLPPGLSIRRAREAEARAIRAMVLAARLNPSGLKWERFLVAVDVQNAIAGCIQLKPHADGSLELASLVVAEPWRGRGVGRALVEAVKAEAEPPLWLMCRSGLAAYYRRFGFQEVGEDGEMPRYFRRVRRLMGVLAPIRRRGEYLAVMVWDEGAQDPGP